MKSVYNPGEKKEVCFTVATEDIAAFKGKTVHEVCSTFTLAREMEWAGRQFALDIREEDEEGVGTMVEVIHHAPAFIGEEIKITATLEKIIKNEIICSILVTSDGRKIASGKTGQKILKREKLKKLFSNN